MTIAVLANDEQWRDIKKDGIKADCIRIHDENVFTEYADALLILNEGASFDFRSTTKPVFINLVCSTLSTMQLPQNVLRINGWNSFLSRNKWEIAGLVNEPIKDIILSLGKVPIVVADQEGFVSARIISMIINEAYFALGENISTKDEIDIAMKLGTNYPYGPFEWASIIGVQRIFSLLEKLSTCNKRYLPAPLLIKEATA